MIGCIACDKFSLQVFHFYEDIYSSYSLRFGPSVPNFVAQKFPKAMKQNSGTKNLGVCV